MAKVKKVMIIGVDAPITPRVRKFAAEGKLPTTKRLLDSGVVANNCMVPYPTITPPNWTTIVTGAWPGTHGITCFHVYKPGDPLDRIHAGFDTRDTQAEFLWNAIGRVGKRSIVLNYPSTWPSTLGESGVQVAGVGLSVNEWRCHDQSNLPWDVRVDVSDSQLFSTEPYPQSQAVKVGQATGWANAPKNAELEFEIACTGRKPLKPMTAQTWHALVLKDKDGQCAEVLVCETKDAAKPMCRLKVGQWSEKLTRFFQTQQGVKKAVFQFKLLALSPDGAEVKLFLSPLCSLSGFTHPAGLADELAQLSPMPWPNFGYEELNREWIDDATHLDIMKSNHDYLCAAADYLLSKKPWDLFCTHLHCPDWAYHAFGKRLDPRTSPDAGVVARFERLEQEFYAQMDRYFEAVLRHASEDTLVIIVSDHGAQTTTGGVPIGKILAEAGLTVFKPKPQGQPGPPEIDWTKTKAAVQRSCYIYVNVKGRDPQGIVEPGKEYEQVREAIIKALYNYTDPELGIKPIVFALRAEDARVIGLYGDRIGDVVFAVREERCGQHGMVLPTAKFGIGSIEGLFIMAGPGVKKGQALDRNVWLTDVVPTVCHLAEWPIPKQAEGAILYQALVDPDLKLHELERCRKNYERLERTFEAEKQLTHSYNQ